MADVTREQVVDFLSNLSVMDIAALTKELEEKWGVTAAPAAVAVAAPGAAAPVAEEPTEFNVVLTSFGAKKIQVIKALREVVGGLGLKEAKELVESAPKAIKEAVSKEEAEEVAAKMKESGAEIKIEPA